MLPIADYDVYIFDCDGVVFDSNSLKINAMKKALSEFNLNIVEVEECVDYFTKNFGRSRFFHIQYFLSHILSVETKQKEYLYDRILNKFSESCRELYIGAEETTGFNTFISKLKGKKYIASGSEQNELRAVFRARNFEYSFVGIYGSPTKKSDLVKDIVSKNPDSKCVMFGDALSDLNAAVVNNIDFIAYTPYSNVKEKLLSESIKYGFDVWLEWPNEI